MGIPTKATKNTTRRVRQEGGELGGSCVGEREAEAEEEVGSLAKFWKSRTESVLSEEEEGLEEEEERQGRRKENTPNVRDITDWMMRKIAKVLITVITSKFSLPMCSRSLDTV